MLGDERVGVPDRLALHEFGRGAVVCAVVAHGAIDGEVLAEPGLVVLDAVARRGVDEARSVFERDILGGDDAVEGGRSLTRRGERLRERIRVNERVAIAQADEFVAGRGRDDGDVFRLADLRDGFEQFLGDDGGVAVDPREGVLELLVHGDREVRGERPRRGRPDHERRARRGALADDALVVFVIIGRRGREAERVVHGVGVVGLEIDIDRGVFAVLVFEFCFGERGLVRDRPVHGLELAEDESLLDEVGEEFDGRAFERGRHGEVGVLVIGEGEQALHLAALEFDILLGVGLARLAHGDASRVFGEFGEFGDLARGDEVGHDLGFDGQAVAVPAGDIGGVEALHGARADDEVLEALVEEVAQVDVAVGVGRAVMEDERLGALARFACAVVEVHRGPALEGGGLILHEVGLHGEGRLGQIERAAVVALGFGGGGVVGHVVGRFSREGSWVERDGRAGGQKRSRPLGW